MPDEKDDETTETPPTAWTTEEAMERLFPPEVREQVADVAADAEFPHVRGRKRATDEDDSW